jgi:glutathione S-transferase
MKLFYASASPFARQVLVLAYETGQADRIGLETCATTPVNRNPNVVAVNPSGRIPVLILDDGTSLFDSRVICQYLDHHHTGPKMYPVDDVARWETLRREALAQGLLDAAVLARYEMILRPKDKFWPEWLSGQIDKINSSLNEMEKDAASLSGVDAGLIAYACALGYLDFRFADHDWRAARPKLSAWFAAFRERSSMTLTAPSA